MKTTFARVTAVLLAVLLVTGGLFGCAKPGEPGAPGADGRSAYELAVENGFRGSEAEWLASLTGPKGQDGQHGQNGQNGQDGAAGVTPRLRINVETNLWELSYDDGASWVSLGVAATGSAGEKGDTGTAGADGVGVANAYVGEDLHLWLEMSDGSVIDAGYVGVTVQAPAIKNIILIIGDGMGPEHIAAGVMAANRIPDFTSWQNANVNTDSANTSGIGGVTTDSAAAATALATGCLTVNGYLGLDHEKANLKTILDYAKQSGKATGILTTDYLYGATPAGFSAHVTDRNDYAGITASQGDSGVDFLCGLRKDSHYLTHQPLLESKGYAFATSAEGLEQGIPGEDKFYLTPNIENQAEDSLRLSELADMALQFLSKDEDGFVLVIEQAHIDKAAHSNDMAGVTQAMESLFDTVDAVMAWIGDREDTAVLITADHETGGLAVSGNSGALANRFTTATGDFSYAFATTGHTDQHVKLFIHGYEVNFRKYEDYSSDYLIKNTDVFRIMKEMLDEGA